MNECEIPIITLLIPITYMCFSRVSVNFLIAVLTVSACIF